MADKFRTRFQAKVKNGITEVKVLVTHPMDRKSENSSGHFIDEVKCEHNGKVVMSGIWSAGISKNPYCAFKFKGGAKGDSVKFNWKDNQGNTRTTETNIR
ncbi:MAG: thiosulfate oxidation carrier complex protein SoxZ [Gammaproteobacteria bacterium]|nr:MAG: thiosulfate oxidation carrier complex protein SoxZ [Gammaproteobacteria bacterium]RKZ45343.1 MAG: thiosulfate oxidation carrier complex protein SoxZ [Gammaproteobacteria bacterium]RKZ72776.1 MAG: thiosulfate oxidation carrier complex protein SoxZ [Gammaproteobacteria bacterium]